MNKNRLNFCALIGLVVGLGLSTQNDARAGFELGAFAGAKTAASTTHFLLGLDAELPIMPFIGAAAFFEQSLSTPAATSFGGGIAIHPIPLMGLRLVGQGGLEMVSSTSEFFFRVGAGYNIGVGPVMVQPVFNLDFVSGSTAMVYGVTVGIAL